MQYTNQQLNPLNFNLSSCTYAVIYYNPAAPININTSKAFNICPAPEASGINKEFNLTKLPLLYTRFAITDTVAYLINIITPL